MPDQNLSIGERLSLLERELKDQGHSLRRELDVPTNGFATVIYNAADHFSKHGPREAAALSYYALFSLFPLLLLVVVGVGQIIGPATTGTQINDFLSLFLPGQTATEVSNTIQRFVEEGNSASIFAFLSLLWSGLGLFSNLDAALSRTFRDDGTRSFFKRRIAGFIMVLVLGVLLVANILTSLLFSMLSILFLGQNNIWFSIASIFIPFGFSMGLFAMMYRFVPRTKVGWDAIWPAAIIGGIAWELAKRVFSLYLDTATTLSVVYGSITTVIVFMLWAYVTCTIILFCAEFCVSLSDWLTERKQSRPEMNTKFANQFYERRLALENQGSGELEDGIAPKQ